jgi:hypothetical protein
LGSADGFSKVTAGIVAVFAVPPIWNMVDGYVAEKLFELYDDGLVPILYYGLMIAAYPLVYFAIRMSLVSIAVTGLLGFAMRYI